MLIRNHRSEAVNGDGKEKAYRCLSATGFAPPFSSIPSGQSRKSLRSERDCHSSDRGIPEKAQALKVKSPAPGWNQGRGQIQQAGQAAMPNRQKHYRLAPQKGQAENDMSQLQDRMPKIWKNPQRSATLSLLQMPQDLF